MPTNEQVQGVYDRLAALTRAAGRRARLQADRKPQSRRRPGTLRRRDARRHPTPGGAGPAADGGLAQLVGLGTEAAPQLGATEQPRASRPTTRPSPPSASSPSATCTTSTSTRRIGVFRACRSCRSCSAPAPSGCRRARARSRSTSSTGARCCATPARPAGRLPPRLRVRHAPRSPGRARRTPTSTRCSAHFINQVALFWRDKRISDVIRERAYDPSFGSIAIVRRAGPGPAQQPQVHLLRPPQRPARRGACSCWTRRSASSDSDGHQERCSAPTTPGTSWRRCSSGTSTSALVTSPRQRMGVAGREMLRWLAQPHILQTHRAPVRGAAARDRRVRRGVADQRGRGRADLHPLAGARGSGDALGPARSGRRSAAARCACAGAGERSTGASPRTEGSCVRRSRAVVSRRDGGHLAGGGRRSPAAPGIDKVESGQVRRGTMVLAPGGDTRVDADAALGEVDRRGPAYVRWVQEWLNRLEGAGLAVDGVAGPRTRAAIRALQGRRGLVQDGVAGPRTEAALLAAGAPPPPGAAPTPRPAPGPPGGPKPGHRRARKRNPRPHARMGCPPQRHRWLDPPPGGGDTVSRGLRASGRIVAAAAGADRDRRAGSCHLAADAQGRQGGHPPPLPHAGRRGPPHGLDALVATFGDPRQRGGRAATSCASPRREGVVRAQCYDAARPSTPGTTFPAARSTPSTAAACGGSCCRLREPTSAAPSPASASNPAGRPASRSASSQRTAWATPSTSAPAITVRHPAGSDPPVSPNVPGPPLPAARFPLGPVVPAGDPGRAGTDRPHRCRPDALSVRHGLLSRRFGGRDHDRRRALSRRPGRSPGRSLEFCRAAGALPPPGARGPDRQDGRLRPLLQRLRAGQRGGGQAGRPPPRPAGRLRVRPPAARRTGESTR